MPNCDQINMQACISALEDLQNGPEDAVFSTPYKDHLNLLQSLNTVLSNKVEVGPTDADRVLKICLRYSTDVRCVLYVFSIISKLIDIDKDKPLVDFLPFALAIMEFLNTMCHKDNTSILRILSFQLLMKHPKSTLIKLIRDHSPNIIQTFQQIIELDKAEDLALIIESFKLLLMLEWLPPYEKKLFVEAGLTLWLAGVIPAMMQIVVSTEDVNKIEVCLTSTELLAKELVHLNYYQNPHWKSLLESIANPKMFPASIMGLLENGKDYWHRIWIVLIKILKSQLTRNCSPFTSPINSMLPIVEYAFKKESAQRVQAFACWNELIESFYHESGNCTEKRIKLLIIPMKLYNTKTEETAVAKFQTWWHFIHKFRPKIQKYTNEILIYFLHFMFGPGPRHHAAKQFQASQVSECLRKKCIDAFAEIMHVNCSNCAVTNLKRLDSNIATTILLVDHWKDFVHALKSCIWAVAQSYTKDTKSKIQCIWISFVMRLAAMSEETLRQDMFDDLINIVSELTLEDGKLGNENLMEILVDDITLPLWRDDKLKILTESKSQSHRPMHRIVKLIMDDVFNNYFKRFNSEEVTRLLQPLINTILEESISTPDYIIWLLDELLVTNSTLLMWTALAQASKESKLNLEAFNKILLWPFKTVHVSFEVKEAAEAWYTLYNSIHENLEQTDFDNKISKVLTRPVEDNKASNYFVLFALIGVLKNKPDEEKMAKLEALTYEMNDYNDFEQLLIPLVNTIELVVNNSTDENLAQITINCVENILKVIKSETEAIGSKSPIENRENTFSNLRAGSDILTSTLKTYLESCPYQSIKKQVRSLLSLHDKTETPEKVSKSPKKVSKSPWKSPFLGFDIPPKKFASPNIQELKKRKNKEASIETTVVENGEEYVVVKSNWKFNPKILTENQKEKLQRKRDIPALYQDLSQSQDEFKLTSWKTDSQDTSLSSSKSATSNDVSDTLTKITNPDIVPKIMENIYGIEKNSKPKTGANVSPIAKVNTPKADKLSTPGDTKSPRVALKDRVYRNVSNLIRNSSPSPQDKVTDKQGEGNILRNVSKSPVPKSELVCIESPAKKAQSNEKKMKPSNDDVITTNKQENRSPVTSPPNDKMRQMVVYTSRIDEIMKLSCTPVSKAQKDINLQLSAPHTPVDRPARLRRTPRKYDDSLVLEVKKKRFGNYYSQDLLEGHTETAIAQIHKPNDKMNVTDAISPQKVSPKEADTNEKKSQTATDDLIIVENVTSSTAADDKSPKDIEKPSLISPKTSTHKPTAKSPEKPSTGEVPSNLSKASEGVYNDAGQNETYDVKDKQNVKTNSSKPKELHKTPVKKVGAKLVITNHKKIKWRNECEVQNEISSNGENAAVNTPVTTDKDLNQPKLSAKNSVLLNDTDKNTEKVEAVPTPINKTKKDSYTCLTPLSKPQEPQYTPKKLGARHEVIGARHEVITDNMDTLIISPRKFRKAKVQKEINLRDENAAVNTPVTTDKDFNQPKLSAKEIVLQSDTDKNVEKVEMAPVSINKTKKDSDISLSKSTKKSCSLTFGNENEKLSNTLVKTKDACPAKLTRKKVYDVETENNKDDENLSPKTQKKKTSRIEKELAIDMVEGNPFHKIRSAKRLTRNKLMEAENGSKRKTLIDKLNKSKLELTPKTSKKDKKCSQSVNSTLIVEDSQDKKEKKAQSVLPQNVMDESPCSEDVIESSQDSTMTTICVKAKKRTPKLLPVVALEKITLPITLTQGLIKDCKIVDKLDEENHERTDIELPQNKSVESHKNVIDLTENMDTEPLGDSKNSNDLTENMDTEPLAANETVEVIILRETLPTPVTVNSESEPVIGPETQELAEADTQPNDPKQFEKWEINKPLLTSPNSNPPESLTIDDMNIENDITQNTHITQPEAAHGLANMDDTTEVSSPCKDDNQRKQDFLNNTIEISPIKIQSPDRQQKSPSPETSSDFVVIQLSSPVHSNGEPFEKQCSPEFFTEDKVSPEKQNASPPRIEVTVTNSSPSASLSLKKNRPCSGRAAQMFGLLSMTSDNEIKQPQLPTKPGLRFNYFKNNKNDCTVEQNPSTEENYLELQRSLPTVTSSPSGPILKRKHVEIIDESTASPVKRKRVSFHDPPVSTTVSVQKYIEPISLMRSPQTSAKKRQTRSGLKSPKKLDNAFLASALSKTVQSFTETTTPSDETENISLDVTPAVEIVKTSELNDTDPICPDLIDCTDPIDVIAIELSSAAMRDLFVKELEGKVDTVGDLAKMTELEVNRLCIKAPKIIVAKKVLTDYITNRPAITVETVIEEAFSEPMTESLLHVTKADMEMQTDEIEVITKSTQVTVEQVAAQMQTEVLVSANTSVQTIESGFKTTEEIIDSCMSEREEFFEKFKEKLSDDQVQSIAASLSAKHMIRLIMNKTDESSTTVVQRVLKHQCKAIPKSSKPSAELTFFKQLFLERYGTADLGSFCTEILQTIFHKPA